MVQPGLPCGGEWGGCEVGGGGPRAGVLAGVAPRCWSAAAGCGRQQAEDDALLSLSCEHGLPLLPGGPGRAAIGPAGRARTLIGWAAGRQPGGEADRGTGQQLCVDRRTE